MSEEPRTVDEAWLRGVALRYLARRASSSANLARVLSRAARRRAGASDETHDALIDAVLGTLTRAGLLDDAAYARSLVASLSRRGTSRAEARNRLRSKGVDRDAADGAVGELDTDERAAAERVARRKRLGPWRSPPDPSRRGKDIAALVRAGFPVSLAAKVVDAPPD